MFFFIFTLFLVFVNLFQTAEIFLFAETAAMNKDENADCLKEDLERNLQEGGFEYSITDEAVIITKYAGEAADVRIPYGVTRIGKEAFRENQVWS